MKSPSAFEVHPSTPNLVVKILLLGESNVGKTSIVTRFTDQKFNHANNLLTIGIDIKKITKNIGTRSVRLELWDTAGQEKYKTLPKQYFRGIQGIMLVYDITSGESFLRIVDWLEKIVELCKIEDLKLVLVGNKVDLQLEREVKKEEAEQFAKKKNMKFKETSAKMATNIEEIMNETLQEIVKNYEKGEHKAAKQHVERAANIQLAQNNNHPEKPSSDCC